MRVCVRACVRACVRVRAGRGIFVIGMVHVNAHATNTHSLRIHMHAVIVIHMVTYMCDSMSKCIDTYTHIYIYIYASRERGRGRERERERDRDIHVYDDNGE